jgi:hypothetical protein
LWVVTDEGAESKAMYTRAVSRLRDVLSTAIKEDRILPADSAQERVERGTKFLTVASDRSALLEAYRGFIVSTTLDD